jgi:hypothetical protein
MRCRLTRNHLDPLVLPWAGAGPCAVGRPGNTRVEADNVYGLAAAKWTMAFQMHGLVGTWLDRLGRNLKQPGFSP